MMSRPEIAGWHAISITSPPASDKMSLASLLLGLNCLKGRVVGAQLRLRLARFCTQTRQMQLVCPPAKDDPLSTE